MNSKQYNNPGYTEAEIALYLHSKAAAKGISVSSTFELTSACNFSCKMCYVHNGDCNKNRKYELNTDQWIEIAKQARDAGVMFLLITGGEPLIRDDFCELYEKISEMGFVISLNSNLSLLNEKHIESLKKYPPNRINVSLYGMSGETYMNLCGVNAFETVVDNIRKLKNAGIPVKVNSSITPRNLCDFEKIYKFCNEENLIQKSAFYMYPSIRLGCNNERLKPEEVAEYSVRYDFLRMTKEQFIERADKAEKGVEYIENSDCIDTESESASIKCRAGSSSSWIDWRGNMSFCGMVPANSECNVLSKGFKQCWEEVKSTVKSIRLPAKCSYCKYKYLCNACAASCFCETGAFDKVPEFICRVSELTAEKFKEYKSKLLKEESI